MLCRAVYSLRRCCFRLTLLGVAASACVQRGDTQLRSLEVDLDSEGRLSEGDIKARRALEFECEQFKKRRTVSAVSAVQEEELSASRKQPKLSDLVKLK